MELALRPMSTSQVLDRTFYIYRNHFVLLAGIGSLLPAMLLVMQLAFIPLGFPPRATAKTSPEALAILLLGYFCCYGVIYLVGTALAGGATVVGVSKLHLGQGVTIGEAYKRVFSRFWRIVGVIVVLGLIVFGSLLVGEFIAIIVIALSVGSTSIFARGGAMMGIGVVVAVIWAMAVFLGAVGAALFFLQQACPGHPGVHSGAATCWSRAAQKLAPHQRFGFAHYACQSAYLGTRRYPGIGFDRTRPGAGGNTAQQGTVARPGAAAYRRLYCRCAGRANCHYSNCAYLL
jgi:hypothetical protein